MPSTVSRGGPSPRRWVGAAALAASLFAGAAHATMIDIHITGVEDDRGLVRVELCTKQTFLTGACPYSAAAPATAGETVVQVQAPPGEYAIQAYHDDTDSGHVHQNFLGIPKERIGFSNDAPLRLHGPRWDDAAIEVGTGLQSVTLRLRHLIGK
jgi:uncharacterized protein (DUF2141 family)